MASTLPLKKARDGSKSQTTTDPRKDPYEPPEDEVTAVKVWQAKVARAEKDHEQFFKDLQKMRQYAAGTRHTDTGTKYTRTNMIFATIANVVPQIYAKNPEVAVQPSKGCPKSRLKLIKDFSRTAEQFLNETVIDEGKLKKRAKANIRSAMITSYGVLKMAIQEEYRGDPIAVRRVQDAQDNLARVEALAADLKAEHDPDEIAKKRDEMRAHMTGLLSGNEVKIFKGFVIDRVRSEDFLVLDTSISEFDEYVDAAALGHKVYMTVDKYRTRFGHYPEKATKYNTPYDPETKDGTPSPATSLPEGMRAEDQYVCVIEIWDKDAGVIRTIAKGQNRWVEDAYAPRYASERWYPFYVLGFNLLEGRWRPLSECELMMGLQDEYNTTRTNYADVRKKAVPLRVFRLAGNLKEEDIQRLTDAKNQDWVGIEGNPTIPINQDIAQLDGLRIDPAAYDVTMIRNDIDLVAGVSDASRANLIKPKTATEAELMAQAMGSRSDERRDVNEDLMSEMFSSALEQGLRCFTIEEIKQVCGEEAVWPGEELSVEEVFSLVDVSVRAGSSGKPNAQKDKEQWLQILPIVKDAMTAVAEARASGNIDMANAAVELLRETIRRFEERIDVDMLIPPVEEGGPAAQLQTAMAQIQQLGEQLTAAQEQLQATTAERDKAMAGEQERIVKENLRAEEQVRKDQAAFQDNERKAQEEDARAAREAEAAAREDEIARYRIDKEAQTKLDIARINARQSDEQIAEKEDAKTSAAKEKEERQAALAESQQRHEEAMQRLEAIMQAITQALAQFGQSMDGMLRTQEAPRRSEIELGEDGLPRALVSRPMATKH